MTVLYFLQRKPHYYVDYSVDSCSEYLRPRRLCLVPHLVGGFVAITVGVVQLWLGLTNRIGPLYRMLGKVYVGAVMVCGCAGFYLALTISIGYFAYAVRLFFLAVACFLNTGVAVWCIRRRQVEQHSA